MIYFYEHVMLQTLIKKLQWEILLAFSAYALEPYSIHYLVFIVLVYYSSVIFQYDYIFNIPPELFSPPKVFQAIHN